MRRRISANQGAATPPGVEIGSASRNWYTKVLIEHPIKTKAITLGILNCVGDIFTQLYVEKSGGLDYRRVASMTTFGLFIVGPTLHYWYSFLNRVVKASGPKGVAIRLVLDQFIFAPIFIAVTFAYLLLVEGHVDKIQDKLSKDWKPALIANWKLWLPSQFCNFMFVPPVLQVLCSNVIGLVWNVYVSHASHKPSGQSAIYKQVAQEVQNAAHALRKPQFPFQAEA
ncbi:uncharacterized protein [Physcomitrium patens]|uniref:Peroxisomal membrane MPV17/PMP22-like protein n=1 Tax=Physcomitrium patens TaxID=3218 RepID=A0A2K1JTA6_PHYPA|nr:PXMP2/4 family protein 2-like isoform X2 [Physcomitrium patens]PNR44716.1 hypothetical protein PHYPA_014486 [Physcomitrium patens]|eukprot:XP_024387945.1 PXMP2/4 family protein 2-like isoform X2 [Physcomitrella patens]